MTIDNSTFQKIILFCTDAHKGQVRKGNGVPYIMHPISVMMRICDIKKNSKNLLLLAGVAMLHDTVEDCEVSIDQISKEFGFHVASLVQELTLDKTKYESIGKTKYLQQHMLNMSSYALTIKLCDRLDNVCDMADMDTEFQQRYTTETHEILEYVEERRAFTKTQKKLAKAIKRELKKYE